MKNTESTKTAKQNNAMFPSNSQIPHPIRNATTAAQIAAPFVYRRGAFFAHMAAEHIPQRRCIPFNKTPEKGTCRMEPQETAKRETEPEEEARRLRFNELWLQVIERSEQRAAQAP